MGGMDSLMGESSSVAGCRTKATNPRIP